MYFNYALILKITQLERTRHENYTRFRMSREEIRHIIATWKRTKITWLVLLAVIRINIKLFVDGNPFAGFLFV
jgi:hypothetical protein